jgi:hypothetical protein
LVDILPTYGAIAPDPTCYLPALPGALACLHEMLFSR